jgi:hypothetical protein
MKIMIEYYGNEFVMRCTISLTLMRNCPGSLYHFIAAILSDMDTEISFGGQAGLVQKSKTEYDAEFINGKN